MRIMAILLLPPVKMLANSRIRRKNLSLGPWKASGNQYRGTSFGMRLLIHDPKFTCINCIQKVQISSPVKKTENTSLSENHIRSHYIILEKNQQSDSM